MCGIVGYISNTDKIYEGPKEHFMRYALALDTLRGPDSTGLVTIRKQFTVDTCKTLMPGDTFVHSKEYKTRSRLGWAQIGHNRAATRGEVILDNAHPFIFGDVCMVHNGTLWNDGRSLKAYDKSLDVDSMQIANALSKVRPEDAPKILTQIDGAFALVWTDRRDNTINMCRNSERPLHFAFNDKKTIMWYMSDGHHLHSINKSFGNHEAKGAQVFEMDKHVLLKFKKGTIQPEVIRFSPFVRTVYQKNASSAVTPSSKTNKTTSNGSEALQRATDKWKMNLEGRGAASAGTTKKTDGRPPVEEVTPYSNLKVDIAGRKRKVPLAMQEALIGELQLTPDNLLQFQPEDGIEREDGKYVVRGTALLKDWADTPWECTIHVVSKVQYKAYCDQDWLVRPIGICPPHEFDPKSPALLAELVHCDWDGYKKRLATVAVEDDDPEVDQSDILAAGPGGDLLPWGKLQNMLDRGCINCGSDLTNIPIGDCMEANNGQDLLCPMCVEDFYSQHSTTPTIN